MKIVFNCFKSISPELLGYYGKDSLVAYEDSASYAYQMLLPLYKVCEGYTGKVVTGNCCFSHFTSYGESPGKSIRPQLKNQLILSFIKFDLLHEFRNY